MSRYKNPPSEGRSLRSIRGDSPAEENLFVEKSPASSIRRNITANDKDDDDFELFSMSSNKGGSTNSFLNVLKKNNPTPSSEQQQKQSSAEKFHQTNLQPFLKKRVYISGDQELKKSTPNQETDKRKSISTEKEFDWKANLDQILDDKSATIDFVAKRISDNDFDSYLENPDKDEEESKGSKSLKEIRSKNVLTYTYTKKPSDSGRNYVPSKEDEENKKYSAYEDWRILDTVDQLLMNEGKTALASRTLWANIKDPSTGKKLLDDKRSSESMRERYKRHLSWLDDDAKEQLAAFAKKHGSAEMKNYYSIIKKVEGVKQLVAISKQPYYDPDTSKFRNNRRSDDDYEFSKMSNQNNRLERGELEEDFAEDDYPGLGLGQSFGRNTNTRQEEEFEFDNEENSRTKKSFKPKSPPKSASEKSGKFLIAKMLQEGQGQRQDAISDDIENFGGGEEDIYPTFGNQKQTIKNFIEVSADEEVKTDSDIIVLEESVRSKKRRREDPTNPEQSQTPEDLILKKVKLTIDYDKKALRPSNVFQQRKPLDQEFIIDENLMIYVDLESENREFIIEESAWLKGLKRLSIQYQVDLESLKETSRKVSDDLDDLERYLESKDAMILWTEEEDQDLLQNNQTALKYLKLLKGQERIQKRIQYLQDF